MATDVEIERSLAALSATLNDQRPDSFDRAQMQSIVTGALGDELKLTVDDGGGVHDERGVRVAVIRRLDDGSWHVERQNYDAQNASTEVPTPRR